MKRILPFALIFLLLLVFFGLYTVKQKPIERAPSVTLRAASYADLPAWGRSDLKPSFEALKISCALFLRRDASRSLGTELIPMTAGDWHPLCNAAKSVDETNALAVKRFFETWFQPYYFAEKEAVEGLFTGYYSPNISGSREATDRYSVPLYGLPDNWVSIHLKDFDEALPKRRLIARVENHRLKPYYARKAINDGALEKHATPIAWIENRVDRMFLEIQGSGVVHFEDGSRLYLGYAGENGRTYTSVAKVLINKGVMTKNSASMQAIKRYFDEHPQQMDDVLHQNESFVFFQEEKRAAAIGAQNLPLTDGYSLAVDLRYIPLGLPIWLSTGYTDSDMQEQPLQRLMVAQDTGGAIRGHVRGDVYWGDDENAAQIAGRMKHPGYYWLLLPKASMPTAQGVKP